MIYPKVIVLILSYNGKHLLEESISSYLQNNYQNFKVIVIDNGSTDGTKEWVEQYFPSVKVLRTDINLKYSGGFNFGLNYAFNEEKADYVLISNNDIKADSKVIEELVKVAEMDESIGFVTGKVCYYDHPNIFQTVGKKLDPIRWNGDHIGRGEEDTGQYDFIVEREFADDVFTLVRRRVYEIVGGYDTTFAFQSEEYDWQVRAKMAGFKIFYVPKAKIWHKVSATIGKASAFKLFYDARNPLIIMLKYRELKAVLRYLFFCLKDNLITSLVAIKRKNFDVAIAVWKGFLSGLYYGLRIRYKNR